MRITALEPQVNNPERINLYVDGRFLLGVNAAIVLQMGLRLEQELLSDQLEQLRSEEAEQQAVDRALNYLSYRPRSREEVRRYLRRKETPPEIIEAALERLDRLDFVNDQRSVRHRREGFHRSHTALIRGTSPHPRRPRFHPYDQADASRRGPRREGPCSAVRNGVRHR